MSDFGRLYERRKLRIYLSKGKVMRHSKNCNVSGITISLRKLKVNEVALNRVAAVHHNIWYESEKSFICMFNCSY